MASCDEFWSSPWSLQPDKLQCGGLQQESGKEIEEATGKPKEDTQEIIQENGDETRHEARNNTENTQEKFQAA